MFLSNLLNSPNPTVFELSMAGGLTTALQPAFDYLLVTLGERYATFFRLCAWKDELYYLLLGIIERHYLQVYDACFSENFYALKRVKRAGPQGAQVPLSPRDKLVSLFFVTLIPYLRMKTVKAHEVLAVEAQQEEQQEMQERQRQQREGSSSNDEHVGHGQNEAAMVARGSSGTSSAVGRRPRLYKRLRQMFLQGVPLTLAGYELWGFYLKILFMFQRTEHFSPPQWLQGIFLARVTGDDMRAQALAEELRDSHRGIVGKIASKGISFLRTALVASALIFKLLEWYYSPENQSQREQNKNAQIIPPPPMPPRPSSMGVGLPRHPRQCPLCHEPRVNPAISSSGIAFCFICIHRHVLEHGACPVTGTPCQVSQIRRIFES
ncbi:Peroxisome assembly protein 12 [Hondaea fermentalgiana]|uniref:Peroxisome assembly protein 12 n=1 Tax=Hondaea fermentalgiana TaxID=2315210 RepID=A0A2R5GKD8_9STRA|nr:Peroxisome assembly protein 12 [Hondaea fermentalgiana]|eukprot:GBG28334.1 Peroxisome assembly protein 12 [Hondaea fermentalgiana]